MAKTIKQAIEQSLGADAMFGLDFRDLEGAEYKLIDLATHLSEVDEPRTRALGRAIKNLAPGWTKFVQGEFDRHEEYGPANAILGLQRACAMLIWFLAQQSIKPSLGARAYTEMVENLSGAFKSDLELLVQGNREIRNAAKTRNAGTAEE